MNALLTNPLDHKLLYTVTEVDQGTCNARTLPKAGSGLVVHLWCGDNGNERSG